jgi:hypothetical protein
VEEGVVGEDGPVPGGPVHRARRERYCLARPLFDPLAFEGRLGATGDYGVDEFLLSLPERRGDTRQRTRDCLLTCAEGSRSMFRSTQARWSEIDVCPRRLIRASAALVSNS